MEVEGSLLDLSRISRLDMGVYLCIATNGVPPSVSKRINVSVDCESHSYHFIALNVPDRRLRTCLKDVTRLCSPIYQTWSATFLSFLTLYFHILLTCVLLIDLCRLFTFWHFLASIRFLCYNQLHLTAHCNTLINRLTQLTKLGAR